MRGYRGIGAFVVLGCLASGASAASLNLPQYLPDIYTPGLQVNYTYDSGTSTGSFEVSGFDAFAVELDGDFDQEFTILGSYQLNATLSSSGELQPGGTVVINGDLYAEDGVTVVASGDLLTGSLQKFGFANGVNDTFEFLFYLASSAPQLKFGPVGTPGGIKLTTSFASSPFDGAFDASFAAVGGGDTFAAVPTPAAAGAGLVLMGMLASRRRRQVLN